MFTYKIGDGGGGADKERALSHTHTTCTCHTCENTELGGQLCVQTHQSGLPGKPRVESNVVFTYKIGDGGGGADKCATFVDCASSATTRVRIPQYVTRAEDGTQTTRCAEVERFN